MHIIKNTTILKPCLQRWCRSCPATSAPRRMQRDSRRWTSYPSTQASAADDALRRHSQQMMCYAGIHSRWCTTQASAADDALRRHQQQMMHYAGIIFIIFIVIIKAAAHAQMGISKLFINCFRNPTSTCTTENGKTLRYPNNGWLLP